VWGGNAKGSRTKVFGPGWKRKRGGKFAGDTGVGSEVKIKVKRELKRGKRTGNWFDPEARKIFTGKTHKWNHRHGLNEKKK